MQGGQICNRQAGSGECTIKVKSEAGLVEGKINQIADPFIKKKESQSESR
jgi:hypothetical protein